MPATAWAAPMFASCALRPVSLWVFWLRTSIFVYGRVRQRFGKIGLQGFARPARLAPDGLQKLRRRRSVGRLGS